MKKLNFLIVMDDIATINYKKDTSLAMMWAIAERGHGLAYCGIHDLWLDKGELCVDKQDVEVFKNPDDFYKLGEKSTVKATEFDVILMRKDPPFDMNFLYALHLLEYAKRAGVLVANDPNSVRACNEKLFATQFSELMSPTIVTAKESRIRSFIDEHQDVIVKPLDGMGGMSIFRLTADSPNIGSTLEMLTQLGTLPIMAQKYLPEIKDGDKRVLIVGGKVVPFCLARIPQGGETRGNLAAGGHGVAMPLTDAERAVAEKVAPTLVEKGLYFVGLDLIGAKITEINVTSPTCVREIDEQCGTTIAVDFIEFIENLVK
ncbi:glutathione synthase [Moraxella bovis]|uniref:glutathione synthase n=1 Tax=Moraxella bovis TaxID=476 RepID=UPI00222777B8|nr:glutathione synthase [Moraxella bovis]UYZ69022.1 glutathione synthase [Moraxella bovis]UYZ71396.1 glutathione synthase [Moraxella bovis]UYZ72691.1 glutathione synthase [Moraxella bovis]UZA14689.1 glutathione synthase [Moraxella bovis]UZA26948.1 glutathione synthase [Moraxella bovis]